jgi:hypothetical protein
MRLKIARLKEELYGDERSAHGVTLLASRLARARRRLAKATDPNQGWRVWAEAPGGPWAYGDLTAPATWFGLQEPADPIERLERRF